MAKIDGVQEVAIAKLKPYERNAKVHGQAQVEQIVKSIEEFGFLSPCLIDKELNIIAGHGRVAAAKQMGLKKVPCVFIEGLTDEQRRAYIIADNRLTELGGWDEEMLDAELKALFDEGFDIELTGFELNLDEKNDEDEDTQSMNPVVALPQSRILVCSISAFGTESEKFIEISLTPDEAERLLKRTEQMAVSEIAERMRGVVNDL